jgi:uncharacterized protein (DUF885 family)
MIRTLLLTAALISGASTPVFAQSTELDAATPFCADGTIVIVDDVQTCQAKDNLEKLIADVEAADIAASPYSAGFHGDQDALRRLPDVSQKADKAYQELMQSFLERHSALASMARTGQAQLNYDLLGFMLGQRIQLGPFDEARVPFTNDSGFFNELSYIGRQTIFETSSDYEAYAARLSALPRYFGQHKTNMRRGIETGYTASGEILPGIISTIKTMAEADAAEHPFYAPFKSFPESIEQAEQQRLQNLGEAAMENAVLPAYRELLTFFEKEYQPKARPNAGIGTNQENRAYYAALVRHFTTLDLTPDEVHAIGLSEVKRIRAEMDDIIGDVGFDGSFADFLDFLRTDPQFYAPTEEQLLKEAAWLAKQIDGKMPEFFGTLPRLSYGVQPVPKEIAPTYTTGRYWGGSPEQGRAGNYMVNTHNLSQRPLYNLPALTLHEGVPGHHHQISLGQELKNVPKFRQNLYPNAFGEGWGLYSEKLGVEMGVYKTPYENFGRLTYEMWRACRLVVDTGMHWKGWTREQAEACFFENSALAPHNIKTEVERYISWPGQALAYKIGELKILELRARAEKALGDQFSIRDFHDAVLLDGGIPLDILEAKIDRWIGSQKAEAAKMPQTAP